MNPPTDPSSPYSPPAEPGDDLPAADLESKRTFWQRAAWVSGALSAVVPLLGMIGTIIAMRKAFAAIGGSGVAAPKVLTEAIGESLISTAAGLFLTLPILALFVISRLRFRSYRARIRKLATSSSDLIA